MIEKSCLALTLALLTTSPLLADTTSTANDGDTEIRRQGRSATVTIKNSGFVPPKPRQPTEMQSGSPGEQDSQSQYGPQR